MQRIQGFLIIMSGVYIIFKKSISPPPSLFENHMKKPALWCLILIFEMFVFTQHPPT